MTQQEKISWSRPQWEGWNRGWDFSYNFEQKIET